MSHRYRTIWLSDVHLGTSGCQAAFLLDFLKHHESETLYLVGDIIDGWQLKKSWGWKQSHNDVVQKVLRKARKGTQVIYVPGNHDEAARQYCGLDFGGIAIRQEAEHLTADGKRLLVIHGDEFDGVIQHVKWLAYVGDSLYTVILHLNRYYNWLRQKLGRPYWSLSQYLKHKVKNAVNFISDFEQILGHIHKAEVKDIGGILYGNCGDWVESLSALVEHADGRLEVVYWTRQASSASEAAMIAAQPVHEGTLEEAETCAS